MSELLSNLMEITQTHVEEVEVIARKPEDLLRDFEQGPNEKRVRGGLQAVQQAQAPFTQAKENQTLVKDILQMDDKMVETFYAYAYEFFTKGRYFDAFKLFRLLVILNIADYRFVFGLAECLKHLEFPYLAFQFYNVAGGLALNNPTPYWCAAEAAQDFGDDFHCLVSLEKCLILARGHKQYQGVYMKAHNLYESMLSKVHAQVKT